MFLSDALLVNKGNTLYNFFILFNSKLANNFLISTIVKIILEHNNEHLENYINRE